MRARIESVRIAGVGSAVPRRSVGLAEIQSGAAAEERQHLTDTAKLVGVEQRRVADPATTTADFCEAAAAPLLDALGWDKHSIGLLAVVTQTPERLMPSEAPRLQDRLGLGRGTATIDLTAGCAGYTHGLWTAATLLAGSDARRALLLIGDTLTRHIDQTDASNRILFGDAAAAVALERTNAPPMHFVAGSDGAAGSALQLAALTGSGGFSMQGFEVAAFVRRTVPTLLAELAEASSVSLDSVDLFLLHQANQLMLRSLGRKLNIPEDRMPLNLDRFGNTSSASIPLLMSCLRERLQRPARTQTVFAGFGAGLAWSAMSAVLEDLVLPELVEL